MPTLHAEMLTAPLPENPTSRLGPPDSLFAPTSLASLREPDDDVATFATVLAHRLRSVVGSIQGYAELLTTSVRDEDRPLAYQILDGTAAIERMLADLLFFSRQPEPARFPIPVASFMAQWLNAIGATADRIDLTLDLPPDYRISADPVLLRQALLILLDNALEATPESESIALILTAGAHELQASMTNRFRGHTPLFKQIFAPFFTTKIDRLGLGLAIAQRIATSHQGSLTHTVNEALNTVTFALILPTPGEH